MQNQTTQANEPPAYRKNLPRWVNAYFEGVAYSLEVNLRNDIGERRVRDMGFPLFIAMAASLFILITLGGPAEPPLYPDWPRPMTWVLGFFGVTLINHNRHRFRAWRRWRNGGSIIHTYYDGYPHLLRWLSRYFPRFTERGCKVWFEPLVFAALGFCILPASAPLGLYLLLAAAALRVLAAGRAFREREMALDSGDGILSMHNMQDNIAAEYQPRSQPPADPHVVASSAPPAPPAPRPERRQQAPAVPSALYQGLNDNLLRLLQEEHRDE